MLNKDFQLESTLETAQGICKYFDVPYKGTSTTLQQPKKPAPMYDLYIDGSNQDLYSTAYPDKLVAKVKELVQKEADTIHIYKRDSKRNPKNK